MISMNDTDDMHRKGETEKPDSGKKENGVDGQNSGNDGENSGYFKYHAGVKDKVFQGHRGTINSVQNHCTFFKRIN